MEMMFEEGEDGDEEEADVEKANEIFGGGEGSCIAES